MKGLNMKINELTGFKSHPIYRLAQQSFSLFDLEKKLEKTEYEKLKLGSGLYAVVYAKPGSDVVYKFFDKNDEGYLRYFNYVKQNQNNPHVPKIIGRLIRLDFSKRQSTSGNESVNAYMLKLEKLEPLNLDNPKHLKTYQNIVALFNTIRINSSDSTRFVQKMEKSSPQLVELVSDIDHMTSGYVDIHPGNVMVRKNGTPVITDV
jgi:hypothetical protein